MTIHNSILTGPYIR